MSKFRGLFIRLVGMKNKEYRVGKYKKNISSRGKNRRYGM